jgi:DNA-binding NarL/FixJ family response regulator
MTTRPVRVLIVDDQEPFRSAARLVVGLVASFEVAADELEPDLVLMDINLPGIDGLEATRRIVAASPQARVVVMSTYEAGEYEQLALEAGAISFIPKSDFDPDVLVESWLKDR